MHGPRERDQIVGLFDRAHDHVHVELHTMAVGPQIDALKAGRLDIGFVRPPVNNAALIGEVLLREPFVAALPARHRLAKKKSVTLSALAEEPFVLPPRQAVPVYHDLVLRMGHASSTDGASAYSGNYGVR